MLYINLRLILDTKTLIVIESPLQLLSAYEAIKHYRFSSGVLLVRLSNDIRNDEQISFLLSYLDFNGFSILKLSINSGRKKLQDLLMLSLSYFFLPFSKIYFNNIIVGSFKSGFMSLLYKLFPIDNSYIIVDDGTSMIDLYKYKRFYNARVFTNFIEDNLSIVTNIEKNSFEYTKSLIESSENDVYKEVVFIGSGISEIGIVSEEHYLDMVSRICLEYTAQGLKVKYIPHRAECKNKLERISTIGNLEVYSINYPIELIGVIDGILPTLVASFYSTALITMKGIYSCDAIAYHFNYQNSECAAEIDGVYNFMRKYIKVEDLQC
jgi:hypothetical protein